MVVFWAYLGSLNSNAIHIRVIWLQSSGEPVGGVTEQLPQGHKQC